MSDSVRVRIAPSPTGSLHVGTARSALYNLLFARHHQGSFILRLEDTDELRSDEVFTQEILNGFRWLGLTCDEGFDIGGTHEPYRQTLKLDRYTQVANQLISQGHAYFCYCTPEELKQLKTEQGDTNLAPRYDNRCRNLTEKNTGDFRSEGRVPAIRFKIEEPRIIEWDDGVRGPITINSSDLGGDMIIVKSSGRAVYNFAVVIDDLDMKISHVIRGEEHINNTPKQLLLYEALGKSPPVFAHVALMIDTERRKLSKRFHGEAVHVAKYQKDGYLPEALLNYLVQMSWTHPEGLEIFSLDEACRKFDLARVSKSPAVFDIQRLNWFNSQYIRNLPLDDIVQRSRAFLSEADLQTYSKDDIKRIVACVREGLTMLSEIKKATQFFFETEIYISPEIKESVLTSESASAILKAVLDSLDQLPWEDEKGCKSLIDTLGKKLDLKGKNLYWPLRVALSGLTIGPDLGSIISILGKSRVRQRLQQALQE